MKMSLPSSYALDQSVGSVGFVLDKKMSLLGILAWDQSVGFVNSALDENVTPLHICQGSIIIV